MCHDPGNGFNAASTWHQVGLQSQRVRGPHYARLAMATLKACRKKVNAVSRVLPAQDAYSRNRLFAGPVTRHVTDAISSGNTPV